MSTDVMIYASDLSKRFGSFRALDRINFEVRRGEVVGFLGPNGAGKSTTMRILTCFISPTAGTAKVHGHDVFDEALEVRRKVGYLPQRAPLYHDMSVIEYLRFAAEMRGLDASTFKKRMHKIVEVCGLAQVLGRDIGKLSHGYRQRVGLGQALVHDPPILILDEPTADLDPNEKAEVIRYIKEIGAERTVLLSTHNLAEVEAACGRAIIVSKGRIVADGPLDDIRAKTGRVQYNVSISEKDALSGHNPPSVNEAEMALRGISGVQHVVAKGHEDGARIFELAADKDRDLRGDLFRLAVDKGWMLLELRRDSQTLEDVFRDLTRADEFADRSLGGKAAAVSEAADDSDAPAQASGTEG